MAVRTSGSEGGPATAAELDPEDTAGIEGLGDTAEESGGGSVGGLLSESEAFVLPWNRDISAFSSSSSEESNLKS